MAVKKQHTHGRTRRRRAGHRKIKPIALIKCPKCNSDARPHYACGNCGFYDGQKIIDVAAKLEKKQKKKQKELKKEEKQKTVENKDSNKK
jgi:large subunit ribosomal protein L32